MRPFRNSGERALAGVLWAVAAGLIVLLIFLILRDDSDSEVLNVPDPTAPATFATAPATTVAAATTVATTTIPPATTTEQTTTTTEPPTTTTEPPTTTTEPPTMSEPPTTTLPPTTTIPGPTNVIATGTLTASSEHPSGRFPLALAYDGLRETSWVSAGDADLACVGLSCRRDSWSSLGWITPGARPMLITEIQVLNSSLNPEPEFQTGFGSVIITIYPQGSFDPVYEQEFDLNGEGPDPDIIVQPNVVGNMVDISFVGHDNSTNGGISELEIIAVAG
jgi:hypothetical protein